MSSVVDMEWELVNVKKEIPQSPTFFPRSPTVKDEQQTLTTGSDAMEEEESGTPIFYGGGLCDPTLTPEKEHSRTSKPSSTGLRPRLLAIVHSCLESKVDQSLGAGENAAVGAETSPKEENVREVVLATEMHLQGSRRVLQSLIHSTEYKLLHPGDQKLARAEVRKLFGSKWYD
jgi:hypothetical protein